LIQKIAEFWRHSYYSDKFAFYVELVSVIFTVLGSTLLAFSAAAPDMRIIYPLYFVGSVAGVVSAWRRKMAWIMVLCCYFAAMNVFGFFRALGVV